MCLNPIKVPYYKVDGKIVFDWNDNLKLPTIMYLKCGKCVQCDIERSNEWATRICHEASLYDKNCVITLTFDNEHCPFSINPRDVQLFCKRLFKKLGTTGIRRFYCGEYGSKFNRPHYHLILFNFRPDDLEFFYEKNGIKYYKSKFISDVWKNGYILVSDVNYQTARYCAKYLQKSRSTIFEDTGRMPPFIRMSNRPGIGYEWAKSNINYRYDYVLLKGKKYHIPRYYDKKFLIGTEYEADVKSRRIYNIVKRSDADVYARALSLNHLSYKKFY